jgi:hypothetical protein
MVGANQEKAMLDGHGVMMNDELLCGGGVLRER